MQLVVVGPGALGCLFAARLAAQHTVTLLDHRPERAARLHRRGLVLEGPGDAPARQVAVAVTADASALAPELVFLCTKVDATASALAGLKPGTPVVVLQNGLGRLEAVAGLLGDAGCVVGALTTEGATSLGEGHVRHAGAGRTVVGALTASGQPHAARAREALAAAGFAVDAADDIQRAAWEKAQVNAAINALTGILRVPNGRLLDGAARELAQAAAAEVGKVAAAKGVAGNWSPAAGRARWEAVSRATALNISSTLQDLRLGRKTEVHAINGAVAEAADALGVEAPVNRLLAQLVQALEELGPDPGGAADAGS